jgi:hypothetical protein
MKPFSYEPFGATKAMRENGAVIFSDMRQLPELLV